MNLALWLIRNGESLPDRIAIGHGGKAWATYAETAAGAMRLAGGLTALGTRPGDRVAIFAGNCPDYVMLMHAIWLAGGVAVPVNAKLHGAELGYILQHSGSRFLFASGDLSSSIVAHVPPSVERMFEIGSAGYAALQKSDSLAPVERADGDPAWLFYTSGTTGRPKGAVLSHGNLAAMTFAYLAEVDPTEPGDSILHAAPLSHGSGMYMLPHVLRAAVNVVPESSSFDPSEIFVLAAHWRGTSMFAAPTMVNRMAAADDDFDAAAFRTIVYGGAPMYVEDVLRARTRFGPRLAQIYGQGESPMTISTLSRAEIAQSSDRARLGSAGRAFACLEVAVVDGDDRLQPAGTPGEIVCRGAPVMQDGYWRDAEATARALKGGWLHTGDVGFFDGDGYLTINDRTKDLIISGGSNIYPREVEEVLLRASGVREVAVIGRTDPDWGEIVVAYYVGDADETALDRICIDNIARFKRPKQYVRITELPKNNYGKILKTELRRRDAAR